MENTCLVLVAFKCLHTSKSYFLWPLKELELKVSSFVFAAHSRHLSLQSKDGNEMRVINVCFYFLPFTFGYIVLSNRESKTFCIRSPKP